MNINWILSLFLLPLYYIFGFVITALITILDGFVNTYTKYHCILFVLLITISFFDMLSICWWICIIGILYFIENYNYITKQYVTLKRTTENTLKMINLEKKLQFKKATLTPNDIIMIENTNKMFGHIDNIVNRTQSSYNFIKSKSVYLFDSIFRHKLCNYIVANCNSINNMINNSVIKSIPVIIDNLTIFYELLLDIQPIGKYITKLCEYYNCCLLLNKEDSAPEVMKKQDINMDQLNDMNNLLEGFFMNMPNIKTPTKSNQNFGKLGKKSK